MSDEERFDRLFIIVTRIAAGASTLGGGGENRSGLMRIIFGEFFTRGKWKTNSSSQEMAGAFFKSDEGGEFRYPRVTAKIHVERGVSRNGR